MTANQLLLLLTLIPNNPNGKCLIQSIFQTRKNSQHQQLRVMSQISPIGLHTARGRYISYGIQVLWN